MTDHPRDDRGAQPPHGSGPFGAGSSTPGPDQAHHQGSTPAAQLHDGPAPWERPRSGQEPTQELRGGHGPVWAHGTDPSREQAFAPRPMHEGPGSRPIGPPSNEPRRRGWIIPAAVAGALLLGGGGGLAATLGSREPSAPAALQASSSSTAEIGAKTAPQVDQSSPVAPDWSKTADAASPSVVSIAVRSGSAGGEGSGVIVDPQGHVVTNNHVVAGGGGDAKIMVTLSDQRAYSAKVVGLDPSTDLAVLQIEGAPKDLHPIAFGDSSRLRVGQPVMAVGNPLGLSGTVTTGIVSALNRPVTTQRQEQPQPDLDGGGQPGQDVYTNAIQTSAAINPGNSGGALVDAQGRLIGINSSIASLGSGGGGGQSGNIGIGFAIPVNEVSSIAKQLIAHGKADHAYLGVGAPTGVVKDGSGMREAAVVKRVLPGTPADKVGLREGDAIVSLDGTPITGYESLISQVYGHSVGEKVTIEYLRDGKRAKVDITFTKRTEQS